MAIEILRATRDGDLLSPGDLYLVELAVNKNLTPEGCKAFRALYENATKADGYTPPFLFGIEHLTRTQIGDVLWKGVVVEHFDHDYWRQDGWVEKMKADSERLAARCLSLEARGVQPTLRAVITRYSPWSAAGAGSLQSGTG